MIRNNGLKGRATPTHRLPRSKSPRKCRGLSIRTGKSSFTHDLSTTLAKLSSFSIASCYRSPRIDDTRVWKQEKKVLRKRLASLPVSPARGFRSPASSSPTSPKAAHLESPAQAQECFEAMQKPVPGVKALDLFQGFLSDYEKIEILSYLDVYFLGLKAVKLKTFEKGFDDDRGDYHVTLWDHLAYRFEVVDILGKGSFGQVLQCFDHQKQEFCAVKVIRNQPRFHQQARIEIAILTRLTSKDRDDTRRVVHFKEHFDFRGHLCLSFELLSTNLYQLLKQNHFCGFSESLVRRFSVQILTALRFLRKEKVIHCDIKPENLLLKKPDRAGLKVVDFGSACFENEKMYTYVQSRFYRAPEVLLGLPYGLSIDMWSFGCVLAELILGVPLFPGRTEVDQLLAIVEVRGLVPDSMLSQSSKRKQFFDSEGRPRVPSDSRPRHAPGEKSLSSVLRSASALLIDLLDSTAYLECLQWDPLQRISPTDALRHAWVAQE